MEQSVVTLKNGVEAEGFVIPMDGFNLVFVKTSVGLVACGAFDVVALEKFTYPAVKIGSADGGPIATIEDLLNGVVKVANEPARERGVTEKMAGGEAAAMLS